MVPLEPEDLTPPEGAFREEGAPDADTDSDPGRPSFEPGPVDESDSGKIGPFPNWMSLYVTVIAYTVLSVIVLYVFTRMMDHGGP